MSALRRGALLLGVLLAATWAHGAATPVPLPPTALRPGSDAGPTKVGYAVWLGDVKQIDGVAQTFSVSFVVAMRWHDLRLAHAGPGAKQYALDDIWHPRLLILNEAGDTVRSLPEVADVAPDGTAAYRQRLIGTFSQSLDLRAFPFDRDTFRVPFVSLGHRPEEVAFAPDEMAIAAGMRAGIGLPEKLTIQDWRVESATTHVNPLHVTPGVELASFAFEFTAARRAQHFIIKVILPLVLIVAMSWAVFWIEPNDASTQFGISITAMLTLIAYRFAIDGDVPKLPYLTKLDAFILMSTVLVFLSLIEVMVTTKFANRDRTELARKIDRRCRWIFPLVFSAATIAIFLP
jgi:hypothetical protein